MALRPGIARATRVLLAAALAGAIVRPEAAQAQTERSPADAAQTEGSRRILGKIKGCIADGTKKPLPGLMVQLVASDASGLLRVTGTDESGHYVFQDLPAGSYDIVVGADGYAQQRKGKIQVRPPFQNIVDFLLALTPVSAAPSAALKSPPQPMPSPAGPEATVPVRGRLIDQQKRPVAEVSVTFVALQGKGIFQTFSGEDGGFALPPLPAGRYRVVVVSPGHVSLDLKAVEVSPLGGLDLELSLVDYPLNFKGRQDDMLPREEPRPAPSATP